MQLLKNLSTIILATAIAYFAYALINFSQSLNNAFEKLPPLLDKVEKLESGIRIDSWLTLAQTADKQLPHILKQVEQVNSTMSDIQKQIPPTLNEIKALRTETIPTLLTEIKVIRTETIPPVLKEMTAVREMVPGTLKKVDLLIDKSNVAGRDAAKGAVQGTVEGILTLPLDLIESAGKAITDDLEGNKNTSKSTSK